MPTRSFDVQSESLHSDAAVIQPTGTAGGGRVPLRSTRAADEVYCRRKHGGFFPPPNVLSHARAPKWREIGQAVPRARAPTVTQTALWRRQPVCGSAHAPNLTALWEARL